MDNRIDVLREEIRQKLSGAADLAELDKLRVGYLGKKGSITALLKGMKDLSNEERKTFGA
ncbi:MAG: phenylalanine--tRNA ligase subunit alpha, partial [Ruminococcus sp.]|nr:phenylalanine--tRNA ligase subunit alpha [Ruminococcus sp.]